VLAHDELQMKGIFGAIFVPCYRFASLYLSTFISALNSVISVYFGKVSLQKLYAPPGFALPCA